MSKKKVEGEGKSPKKEGDENWFALPRWLRHVFEGKAKTGERECARRRLQMQRGQLTSANKGVVKVKEER